MPRMIFVNLPVADLPRAMAFYEAVGFTNNPQFTDDSAACMVLSDTIFTMLLTHDRWKTFTSRPIAASGSSEVALALTCESKAEVDRVTDIAGRSGGVADVNPAQDHGFMFSRSYTDPDGHVWELVWMDPAFADGESAQGEIAA